MNIKLLIKDAQLRAENVLFIDDNHGNLEEAQFYNPGLMTLNASEISWFQKQMESIGESDKEHVRLKQYKLLETRKKAQKQAVDNESFLIQSKINVTFIEDTNSHIDRIYQLVQRTNQLNFTKLRCSKQELESLINQPNVISGCVRVTDRYGDYGIVGFYALKAGKLLHFLFSCRIMGMGIEQWVYAQLGYPKLRVVGEVVSELEKDNTPSWINSAISNSDKQNIVLPWTDNRKLNVLMTGGCDLMSLHYYLQDNANIDTEFDYVSPKTGQYATSMHTEFLVQSLTYDKEKQGRLEREIPFYDKRTFSTRFFNKKYDIVVTSILNDCTRGLYVNENRDETIVFGDNMWPLIKKEDWLGLLKKGYNHVMTEEMCEQFYERYKFIGGITTERLNKNMEFIRANLAKETLLIIINAVELNVVLNGEVGRHLRHIEINKGLKAFCNRHPDNVVLIDINKFVHSRNDLADTLRHYQRRIYFELAQTMIKIINERKSTSLRISNQAIGTPVDRLNEILRQNNKRIIIYGATRQGLSLYHKLEQIKPIMIDHEPVSYEIKDPTVYSPDILTGIDPNRIFIIVMDRHENGDVLDFLHSLNLKGYENYIIWPNYIW